MGAERGGRGVVNDLLSCVALHVVLQLGQDPPDIIAILLLIVGPTLGPPLSFTQLQEQVSSLTTSLMVLHLWLGGGTRNKQG